MAPDFSKVLDILLKYESLDTPDWEWERCVGENQYAGTWVCGCSLTGISWEYRKPNQPEVEYEVIAIENNDDIDSDDIDYDLLPPSQDSRDFFLTGYSSPSTADTASKRNQNTASIPVMEPIERSKLLRHAIDFRQLACCIAKQCGNSSTQYVSRYPLIKDTLIRLFELPNPTYFAFVFSEQVLRRCMQTARHHEQNPKIPIIIFVLGRRWDSPEIRKDAVDVYNAKLIPLEWVMITTQSGFKWIDGYTWDRIINGCSIQKTTGFCIPPDATWDDILIAKEKDDHIALYFIRQGSPVTLITSFCYRDESAFFSVRRNARNKKATKSAYDLLLLYIAKPETRILPKELIVNLDINETEARSDLRKVLQRRVPQLSQQDPFLKKRGKLVEGMYRRFKVQGLEEESRQIHEILIKEAQEREEEES